MSDEDPAERERWERETLSPFLEKAGERRDEFRTISEQEIERLYAPSDVDVDYGEDLGYPGEPPYTRGVYPTMYRGKLWTMRQYAGFGTAEETNERFRYLLESGQTGLSVAFDLPTQMGYDSDDAMARGEVGRVGVAIDTLDDMERLFDGIPLDRVTTSMTINATAPILLAMYVALGDRQGVDREELGGTVQNDLLKEFVARGTYIYPVEPSLRLVTDIFDFCSREIPRWNSISISGYHMREAGCTAPQEVAFTLADGLEYVERALDRGLELEAFAPRLSFFFAAHNELLEEVAKFRAARRLWARLMKERYGASDRSARLRFHTQTAGSALTAQQPKNNVARVTVQALAAVLGGTQSLHTNAYDEALALPSEDSARLALRTQQILAAESGVADTVDPLAGSYYVEEMTDRVEEKALEYMDEIEEMGGAARAVEYMSDQIHQAAYRWQQAVEAGDEEVVGVNAHTEGPDRGEIELPDFERLARGQRERLDEVRRRRDDAAVDRALEAVRETARGDDNLIPPIVRAVKERATLGEISDVLREEWGEFRQGGGGTVGGSGRTAR
ncbi:MAG: methylmalonyl-CoA mutase family protein [Candidatus Palauibacterales bacterium]|nr:methylmalonyl-CoA mutase family protein [Candidatus Palauibacterales bacterium]